jgi:hypothetical protein
MWITTRLDIVDKSCLKGYKDWVGYLMSVLFLFPVNI